MTLADWAARWIPPHLLAAALDDLQRAIVPPSPELPENLTSEAGVQVAVRLEASRLGGVLWRNNVGALPDPRGVPVRFGLANDSAAMNKLVKSSDCCGILPVTIRPEHVGFRIGQFVAREIKAPGWKYTGTPREKAQQRFIEIVLSMGGDAAFATSPGTLERIGGNNLQAGIQQR